MTGRCKTCSSYLDFKATKGAKLADRRCNCGGSYEIMSCGVMTIVPEGSPIFSLEFSSWHSEEGGTYCYPYKNRSGDLFVLDRRTKIFHPLPKPANEKAGD